MRGKSKVEDWLIARSPEMGSKRDWTRLESLRRYLGLQLYRGRLALFLGAGVSLGAKLPGWRDLLQGLMDDAGLPFDETQDYGETAERFKTDGCGGKQEVYLEKIQSQLYKGSSLELKQLIDQPWLRAIGAMLMASRRGSAVAVTLNFDDVLELYLKSMGYDLYPISEAVDWARRQEVAIYHPHGFLPSSEKEYKRSGQVVFAASEYELAKQRKDWDWTPTLVNLLRGRTTLFLGLSGADGNLLQLMQEVWGQHIAKREGTRYWGISFDKGEGKSKDRRAELDVKWNERGVFRVYLDSFDDIPDFLLEICQQAAQAAGEHAR